MAGALLTSFFTATVGMSWELTYLVVGFCCLGIAIVNTFFLVVHPEEKGIVIEELDQQMSNVEEKLRRESLKQGEISQIQVPTYDTMND